MRTALKNDGEFPYDRFGTPIYLGLDGYIEITEDCESLKVFINADTQTYWKNQLP
jgi:hypothetical protein